MRTLILILLAFIISISAWSQSKSTIIKITNPQGATCTTVKGSIITIPVGTQLEVIETKKVVLSADEDNAVSWFYYLIKFQKDGEEGWVKAADTNIPNPE